MRPVSTLCAFERAAVEGADPSMETSLSPRMKKFVLWHFWTIRLLGGAFSQSMIHGADTRCPRQRLTLPPLLHAVLVAWTRTCATRNLLCTERVTFSMGELRTPPSSHGHHRQSKGFGRPSHQKSHADLPTKSHPKSMWMTSTRHKKLWQQQEFEWNSV